VRTCLTSDSVMGVVHLAGHVCDNVLPTLVLIPTMDIKAPR
jgi:hypothetical protein